jgi:hypothetical protein
MNVLLSVGRLSDIDPKHSHPRTSNALE